MIALVQNSKDSNSVNIKTFHVTSSGYTYNTGPFTETLENFGAIPESSSIGAHVLVTNNSNSVIGYVDITMNWISNGKVIGQDSQNSPALSPGQQNDVYIPMSVNNSSGVSEKLVEVQIVETGQNYASETYYIN